MTTLPKQGWLRVPRALASNAVIEAAPFGVLWVGKDGAIGYANPGMQHLLGWTPEALDRKPVGELAAWMQERSWQSEVWPKTKQEGRMSLSAGVWVNTSGEKIRLDTEIVLIQAAAEEFAAVYLHEPSPSEPPPTSSHSGFGRHADLLRESVVFLDEELRCLESNRAFGDLTGVPNDKSAGRSLGELLPIKGEGGPDWTSLTETDSGRADVSARSASGKTVHLAATAAAIPSVEQGGKRFVFVLEDITERRRLEQALEQRDMRFEQLAENVPGMLYRFVMTPEGKTSFPYVSPGGEEIWGIPSESLREDASPVLELIHPDDLQGFQQSVMESASNLRRWEFEGRLITPQGQLKWWHAASTPELSENGNIVWQGLLMDVSRQKQIEAELKVAKDKAESAARAKADFLANMSHEIRTPMNGVIGMAELLKSTRLNDKQEHYVDTIRTSSEVLLTILNDVLDMSKMEAGRLELHPTASDLQRTLEDVCTLLAPRAFAKGIEVVAIYDPSAPTRIVCDSVRLRQVFANLIGNAVKFTAEGHILVQAKMLEREGENIRLQFSVSDTGIGISPEAVDRLFQKFEQADRSTSRRFGGTGLGLAISQQLVGLMGGKIEVESKAGKGSTFSFELKLPVAKHRGDTEIHHRDLPTDLRVLVVDDHPVNLEMMCEVLTGWGLQPELASSAEDALRVLRNAVSTGRPFHQILLDYQMPGMDGLDLARAIRAEPGLAEVSLIMISSSSFGDDLQRQLAETGMAAHLLKPVRLFELKQAMADAASPVIAEAAPESKKEETTVPGDEQPELGLRVLLAEDNEVNREVAIDMLQSLGCEVECAANGLEALALVKANRYDLVFMDCQMPEMDGFTATREIRKLPVLDPQPPIVALTAHAMEGDRERCLAAGMDDHLTKPITFNRLREVTAQYSKQSVPTDLEEQAPPAFDRDAALAITGGRESTLKKALEIFGRKAPEWLDEIRKAQADSDPETLRRVAHTLRGAAANVGAQDVRTAAEHIELTASAETLTETAADIARLEKQLAAFEAAIDAAGLHS